MPYTINEEILDERNCKFYSIIQTSGEAIFVPSQWHHQVWNLDDTISVNHNWLNGCNIQYIWNSLKSNLIEIEKEISDCRESEEFVGNCQVMLKTLFGLNFEDFLNILVYILEKRIKTFESNSPLLVFNKYSVGRNHILFDINSIKLLLKEISEDSNVVELGLNKKCLEFL